MLLLTLPVLTGKPFWGSETAGRGGGVPLSHDTIYSDSARFDIWRR